MIGKHVMVGHLSWRPQLDPVVARQNVKMQVKHDLPRRTFGRKTGLHFC